ncbi:MAG TPA: ClpXP protease specificity-enhancing factor SspB, partial [Thermoanaerobaculia bacterium]|nr:ClpXP protease specificity-enhancing factor SspB [Thermoanaerobaculia bacterium]
YFSIGFRTGHPGVEVPRFLREQYPEEIVIILQHQFWGLTVDDDAFSVLLSFGGSRQPLVVPFAALTAFVDPAAQFALRFVPAGEEEGEEEAAAAPEVPAEDGEPARPGEVLRFDPSRKR